MRILTRRGCEKDKKMRHGYSLDRKVFTEREKEDFLLEKK